MKDFERNDDTVLLEQLQRRLAADLRKKRMIKSRPSAKALKAKRKRLNKIAKRSRQGNWYK